MRWPRRYAIALLHKWDDWMAENVPGGRATARFSLHDPKWRLRDPQRRSKPWIDPAIAV